MDTLKEFVYLDLVFEISNWLQIYVIREIHLQGQNYTLGKTYIDMKYNLMNDFKMDDLYYFC